MSFSRAICLLAGLLAIAAFAPRLTASATPNEGGNTMPEPTASPAEVRRENGAVWIEGVPPMAGGAGKECTFAGSLESAIAVTDRPYSYADIMGLTGLAFRTRWFLGNEQAKWCPSSPVGEMPEEIEAFAKATGWPLRVAFVQPDNDEAMQQLTAEFVASIEAGRPVPAYDPQLDLTVVYGYEDRGKVLRLRNYFDPDAVVKLPPAQLGFLVLFVEPYTQPLDPRQALIESLHIAAHNWKRERFTTGPGEYWYGDAAYEDWIGDVSAADSFTEEEREWLFYVNWWNFLSLVDARRAAVTYIRKHAALLDGDSRQAVTRAADLYEQELQLLQPILSTHEAFLGKWSGKSPADWTSEVRQREIELLTRARQLDAAAIAEIEKASASATKSAPTARCGFRRDPMTFIANDPSRQGALVRTLVFQQPNEGDAALIQARIDEILAEQRDDGSFADTAKDTGVKLLELLKLGCPHDRPEVQRAAEAIVRQMRDGSHSGEEDFEKEAGLGVYPLEALCLLGRTDLPQVKEALTWYVEHSDQWNDPWKGCPWTPEVFWTALWAGREIVDTLPTIKAGMRRLAESMNAAGCSAYNDPYGFVDACGQIDLPEARALLEKQIPLILRGQQADGGWQDKSFIVFRALETHGLFGTLRHLPPLPSDWKIVRSIPAPAASPGSVAWDGRSLWVHDTEGNTAIAVSPKDGSVVAKVALPVDNVVAIGWWDDCLAVTQKDPKKLLKVDPASGEIKQDIIIDETDWTWVGCANAVNGKVWVADEFSPRIIVIDPDNPDEREFKILAGPGPGRFAPTPDGVWHLDFWANALIKTAPDGTLLDWGDHAFADHVTGLAYDGQSLWALDADTHRLCIIEKAEPAGT